MKLPAIPITDDHIHIDPLNGRGIEAAKDFRRSGGTHIFLVTKPSWSSGIEPSSGEDYREVFERTLRVADNIREEVGVVVYPVLGPSLVSTRQRSAVLPGGWGLRRPPA